MPYTAADRVRKRAIVNSVLRGVFLAPDYKPILGSVFSPLLLCLSDQDAAWHAA